MANRKRISNKSGATRVTESRQSYIPWILMGVMVGLFVTFLIYLDHIPEKAPTGQSQTSNSETKVKQPQPEKHKASEPQFDFYTVGSLFCFTIKNLLLIIGINMALFGSLKKW